MRFKYFFIIFFLILFASCSTSKKISREPIQSISRLQFINEYIVPDNFQFQGTTVGGLSGIDYDKTRDLYYLVCDDPSAKSPSRFYTAKLLIGEKGIDSVVFTDVTIILNKAGNPYPDITKDLTHSADLEAMRYDSINDLLVRSSEGQRRSRDGRFEIQDPDIIIMGRDGQWKDSFALPANMQMQVEEKGPRHNSVFEGMALDNDYNSLFISLEDAIYEDGPSAGTGDSTAWTRILKFDTKTKKQVAQYAYLLDPVPYPPVPAGAFKINGISDILYAGNDQLIVIERAYSTGRVTSDIRVYLADIKNAADISTTESLASGAALRPLTKKLLLDMNSLGIFTDNIEGVSFGPVFPNGNRSLVFVADNNFLSRQKSQFLLFEVVP